MNVREGFDTTFKFRISNPSMVCQTMDDVYTSCRSRGADGFAFVIQNFDPLALGKAGMEMGYGGIMNSLAVEFDTYYNYEFYDPGENHVMSIVGAFGSETVAIIHTSSVQLPPSQTCQMESILLECDIHQHLTKTCYFQQIMHSYQTHHT